MVYNEFHFSDFLMEDLAAKFSEAIRNAVLPKDEEEVRPAGRQEPIADHHFSPDSYQLQEVQVQWLQCARPMVRVSIGPIGYSEEFSTEQVARLLFEAEGKVRGDSRQMLVAMLINQGLVPAPVQVCKYRL